MSVNHRLRWLPLLLAAALLPQAGCVKSKHPLIAPQSAHRDTRLHGVWKAEIPVAKGKPRVVYCHIGHAGADFPEGVMRLISMEFEDEVPKRTETLLTAFPAGNDLFLNLMDPADSMGEIWIPTIAENYTITKCEIGDGELTFHQIDAAALKEAVESKKIQGEIGKDGSVSLTAATDDLVRFFKANGEKIFSGDKVVFKRVDAKHSNAAAEKAEKK